MLNLHAAKLGQMKGSSQMHVVTATGDEACYFFFP